MRPARNLAAALIVAVAPAAASEVTVVAFGDSLTQGYGLPPDQGFVAQLQSWLDRNQAEVTLINAGVSGDTTAGGRARAAWTLTDEVDAMIVALGGNDVLRGIAPEEARANLNAVLDEATARDIPVLLAGISAPANFGPDYKSAFEAIYPDLAELHGALLFPDFLSPVLRDGPEVALSRYMQPDGIHPNAEGVALVVKAIGPLVLDLAEKAR